MSAVEAGYRQQISARSGFRHTASVDLDRAFVVAEPDATRWDYGLGLRSPQGIELAIWVEPHPASSTKEVERMLRKLKWLKAKLDSAAFRELRELRDAAVRQDARPYRWLTTLSGAIGIAPNSKEARQLAREGLEPPRRQIELP
jgi:hypothetical protein